MEKVQGDDPEDDEKSKVNTYNRDTETVVSASGNIIPTHKEGRFTASDSEGVKLWLQIANNKFKDYLLYVCPGYIMVTYVCMC